MREARGRMNYTPDASVLLLSNTPAHHSPLDCAAGNDARDTLCAKYQISQISQNTKVLHPNDFLSSLHDVDLTACRLMLMMMMMSLNTTQFY